MLRNDDVKPRNGHLKWPARGRNTGGHNRLDALTSGPTPARPDPFIDILPRQVLDWAVTLPIFEIALTLRQSVEMRRRQSGG